MEPLVRHRPLSGQGPVCLHVPTDPAWLTLALAHFDEVLSDHAHCEKKAAAQALSMIQAYPDIDELPETMARLAREECAHLARVLGILAERGQKLQKDEGDPYAQGLQALMRKTQPERRLDRLLVSAIIEARSCERLALLAEGLSDPKLKDFYAELAQSEDGHQALFFRFALHVADEATVRARLESLLEGEAALLQALPLRPAIH
jgi:tRNA-(ms[2]io[6]A)-hydroxylase